MRRYRMHQRAEFATSRAAGRLIRQDPSLVDRARERSLPHPAGPENDCPLLVSKRPTLAWQAPDCKAPAPAGSFHEEVVRAELLLW